jgi:plastocyanin
MRLEIWIIGVMIFLVAGVLGLIAASPDDVSVPKSTDTIEISESISVEEFEAEPLPSEVSEEQPMLPATVEVNVAKGSGVPGCDETSECFIPYEVSISVGGEVIWNNVDATAHTVTSGNPSDGSDGVFDSSLFVSGATFSHTFDDAGTYEYFCMVHPWMIGIIQVS